MDGERRKHPRLETTLPIRFNLNPDHHVVPGIRKMGVGGTLHNISLEGLRIGSRLDLLDVCQIFPEALDNKSAFELEVVLTDSKERRVLISGRVRWYRLSKPEGDIRQFSAGLFLRKAESRIIARNIVESIRNREFNS
jgi:hypothetical protein